MNITIKSHHILIAAIAIVVLLVIGIPTPTNAALCQASNGEWYIADRCGGGGGGGGSTRELTGWEPEFDHPSNTNPYGDPFYDPLRIPGPRLAPTPLPGGVLPPGTVVPRDYQPPESTGDTIYTVECDTDRCVVAHCSNGQCVGGLGPIDDNPFNNNNFLGDGIHVDENGNIYNPLDVSPRDIGLGDVGLDGIRTPCITANCGGETGGVRDPNGPLSRAPGSFDVDLGDTGVNVSFDPSTGELSLDIDQGTVSGNTGVIPTFLVNGTVPVHVLAHEPDRAKAQRDALAALQRAQKIHGINEQIARGVTEAFVDEAGQTLSQWGDPAKIQRRADQKGRTLAMKRLESVLYAEGLACDRTIQLFEQTFGTRPPTEEELRQNWERFQLPGETIDLVTLLKCNDLETYVNLEGEEVPWDENARNAFLGANGRRGQFGRYGGWEAYITNSFNPQSYDQVAQIQEFMKNHGQAEQEFFAQEYVANQGFLGKREFNPETGEEVIVEAGIIAKEKFTEIHNSNIDILVASTEATDQAAIGSVEGFLLSIAGLIASELGLDSNLINAGLNILGQIFQGSPDVPEPPGDGVVCVGPQIVTVGTQQGFNVEGGAGPHAPYQWEVNGATANPFSSGPNHGPEFVTVFQSTGTATITVTDNTEGPVQFTRTGSCTVTVEEEFVGPPAPTPTPTLDPELVS